MGSFSYTCQLSGIPITEGEPAAIIPMLPLNNYYDNSEAEFRKFGKPSFCSNDGPNLFFREQWYPIFGEYADYGEIDSIIHDDNTEAMEKYYGLSIEDIVSALCDNRKDDFFSLPDYSDAAGVLNKDNPTHMELLRMSLTWIHKGIYDKLASNTAKHDYFDKIDLGTPGLLKSLGFEYKGNVKRERYDQLYEKDGFKVYSDGTWIDAASQNGIYDLKNFKRYCNDNGIDIDISEAVKKKRWEQIYDYIIPFYTMKDRPHISGTEVRLINYMLLDKENSSDLLEEFSDEMISIMLTDTENDIENQKKYRTELRAKIEERKKKPKISKFLLELIKEKGNNFLKKNIVDWFEVKSFYHPTGRYLMPIGTSPQCGDYDKVDTFLRSCNDVYSEIMTKIKSESDPKEESEE